MGDMQQTTLVVRKYHEPRVPIEAAAAAAIRIRFPAPRSRRRVARSARAAEAKSAAEWLHKLTGNIATPYRNRLGDESLELLTRRLKTYSQLLRNTKDMDAEMAAGNAPPSLLAAISAHIADRRAAEAKRLKEIEDFAWEVLDDEPRNIGTAEEEQQRLAEADPDAVVDGFGEFLAELGLTGSELGLTGGGISPPVAGP
jgi:hypothetical protein